jgi:N-acetylglutamate synthase-like GNAT family acetyltransferase
MIRMCGEADFSAILDIINESARAYMGVIPEDRWHDPYMSAEELKGEMEDGVKFTGYEEDGGLVAVMGIQDRGDAALIRHAYVRTALRGHGLGAKLLKHLESTTDKPLFVGTWAAAVWAVTFYEKMGYRLLDGREKDRLLRQYYDIPERQVETSVLLARTGRKGP